MKQETGAYPDISGMLARRAEARRQSPKLSYGEKLTLLESLRDRLEPFKKAREARRPGGTAPRR